MNKFYDGSEAARLPGLVSICIVIGIIPIVMIQCLGCCDVFMYPSTSIPYTTNNWISYRSLACVMFHMLQHVGPSIGCTCAKYEASSSISTQLYGSALSLLGHDHTTAPTISMHYKLGSCVAGVGNDSEPYLASAVSL